MGLMQVPRQTAIISERAVTVGNEIPAVRITNLSKSYRRGGRDGGVVKPVDNVSLDVSQDDLLVLLGPSGCGKTTLLRCVAGLERPDEGDIEIAGRLVFSSSQSIFLPPEEREISMIFQSYALWPHMSVMDNIAYPLRAAGIKGRAAHDRVMEVLEAVGLDSLEKQYPSQLSGGQQQRVALARAIVGRSSLILFDEPLSNVDAKVREQLREELLSIKASVGFSALYVTHDQHEAMSLGNKIAVLNSGRIEQCDAPREVYRKPSSSYVAQFVGDTNILCGRVCRVDEKTIIVHTELGEISAASPHKLRINIGDNVKLVSRPEMWTMQTVRTSTTNAWLAEIGQQSFFGPYTQYNCRLGDTTIKVWSTDEAAGQGDAARWVGISASDIHVLASEVTE